MLLGGRAPDRTGFPVGHYTQFLLIGHYWHRLGLRFRHPRDGTLGQQRVGSKSLTLLELEQRSLVE